MKTAQYFKLYPALGDYGVWLTLTKFRSLRMTSGRLLTFKMYIFALKQLVIGKSFKLWVPIPTIATHMAESYLSPGIDWQTEINQYSQNK
jgi:hypothetical protein